MCGLLAVMVGGLSFGLILIFSRHPALVRTLESRSWLWEAWTGWVFWGTISGIDFMSHLPLTRLSRLPVSFHALYFVDFAIGVTPICLLAAPVVFWMRWSQGHFGAYMLLDAGGIVGFAGSARYAIFVMRAVFLKKLSVSLRAQWVGGVAASGIVICMALSSMQLHRILQGPTTQSGNRILEALIGAPAFMVLLVWLYASALLAEREAIQGGYVPMSRRRNHGLLIALNACHSQRAVLWCIAFTSFLRNRNAMLLLLWGTAYGFGYVYWMHISNGLEVLTFCWMVILYHSYLRANLFGVDHGGVWMFLRDASCYHSIIQIKNRALSLLQCIPIAAVILGFWMLHTTLKAPFLTWSALVADSLTAIALGEIMGSFVSVRQAEPIERTSMYSGAMTPGAFLIPVAQAVVMVLVSSLTGVVAVKCGIAVALIILWSIPFCIFAASAFVLNLNPRHQLSERREHMLTSLSVGTT